MELLEEPLRQRAKGVVVDSDTRRKKQQQLMTKLLERKIRLHAQHLYDQRGQAEGMALQDWVQAETAVLENSTLAPVYRKTKSQNDEAKAVNEANPDFVPSDCCA
jgi:polyphosphate kinase